MNRPKPVGVVGGVGPYAGLDCNLKLFQHTLTDGSDQDHLEVYLLSRSADIPDRSLYLADRGRENPSEGMLRCIQKLVLIGAEIIGIPCSTAHAPLIFGRVLEGIREQGLNCRLLHMLEETARHLEQNYPEVHRVGLLSTQGTYRSRVYESTLGRDSRFTLLVPGSEDQREAVHRAITDKEFGIKAKAYPVSPRAMGHLAMAIDDLRDQGAQAVLLGCTEIPLALPGKEFGAMPLIDPTVALARALIREVDATRLKPWSTFC